MRRALVLSAGGMFGAYQAGVWKALVGRGMSPDVVIGASVGSLNAWAIAGGCDPADLAAGWLDGTASSFLRFRPRVWPWPAQLFDQREFAQQIARFWARFRPRREVAIVAVEVPSFRLRLFQNDEIRAEHLLASCSIFGVLPPVRIDQRRYSDGGVVGALPLWSLEQVRAEEAVTVNVLAAYPSLTVKVGVDALKMVTGHRQPRKPQIPMVWVNPARPLGRIRDSVIWRETNIRRWIGMGESDGTEALKRIRW
jgi:predicted acylesterase/phospholipase RssA